MNKISKTEKTEKVHKRALRGKKAVMWAVTIFTVAAMSCFTCFAAGTSASTLIKKSCDILKVVVTAIGFALGVWGVINLMEAHSSNDPSAKNSGIKQFVGGLGIVIVGVALIPILQNYLTENLTA